MKKVLIIILLISTAINTYAYDFSAVCSTGQTLYYKITGYSTVSVTYPSNNYYYGYSRPTGSLIIPDSVLHDSIYYKVVSIGNYAFYGLYRNSKSIYTKYGNQHRG